MKNFPMLLAVIACLAACELPVAGAPKDSDEVPLTLRGCVVAGEREDSYLLTDVEIDGTTLAPIDAFYRFNTTEGLKEQVGHRVEVKGTADLENMDEGRLKVRVDGCGKTETEIRTEGQTVSVAGYRFGTIGSMKLDTEVPTYEFDVASVNRLSGTCEGPAPGR